MNVLSCSVVLSLVVTYAHGHGYLIKPAQRSSAWRAGFNTPVNNDDNGLNCGGYGVQWRDAPEGKCGACGDPYYGDRQNEAGGKYVTGTITGSYVKGQILKAEVVITAFHQGWFEFRLCAHNDVSKPVSQDCLDQTVLDVVGNQSKRFYITGRTAGTFVIYLQLPAEVTCEQCVLQWLYNTGMLSCSNINCIEVVVGNSWNCDGSNCGTGLGPQEQFINCADIQIKETGTGSTPDTSQTPSRPPTEMTTSQYRSTTTTTPPTSTTTTTTTPPTSTITMTTTPPTSTTTTTTTTPPTSTTTPAPAQSVDADASTCRATGVWKTVPGMNTWCVDNCKAGYCPKTHCVCTSASTSTTTTPVTGASTCRATGVWKTVPGMNTWCVDNCKAGYCPKTHCVCT